MFFSALLSVYIQSICDLTSGCSLSILSACIFVCWGACLCSLMLLFLLLQCNIWCNICRLLCVSIKWKEKLEMFHTKNTSLNSDKDAFIWINLDMRLVYFFFFQSFDLYFWKLFIGFYTVRSSSVAAVLNSMDLTVCIKNYVPNTSFTFEISCHFLSLLTLVITAWTGSDSLQNT